MAKLKRDIRSHEFISELKTLIRKIVFKKFPHESADDMFQEVYCRWLANPNTKQTTEQCMIDIMRSRDGRKGQTFEGKRELTHAMSLDDLPLNHEAPDTFKPIENKVDLDRFKAQLTAMEKDIIDATLAGFTLDEIGADLNVTGERVRQIKENVFEKLSQS